MKESTAYGKNRRLSEWGAGCTSNPALEDGDQDDDVDDHLEDDADR